MSKKSHFVQLIEHFILWVLGEPFHSVTLQKYFLYMRVKIVFVLTQGNALSQRFHFKTNRNSIGSSKKIYLRFSKQLSVWEFSICILCGNQWKFLTFLFFEYLTFEINFLNNSNPFRKLEYLFQFKVFRLKTKHFHTKLRSQTPMLRQIEWGVQNRPKEQQSFAID